MRVFGIERHGTFVGVALRSHECPQCESLQTDIVPSAQEWLGPADNNPVNPTFLLSVGEGFDAELVDIFGSAFEAAWQSLQLSDSRLTHEPHIAYTRELLAKWILVLGKQGERDRNQFVEKALALLADSNPKAREFLTGGSSALPRSIVETSWNLTLASRVPRQRMFASLKLARLSCWSRADWSPIEPILMNSGISTECFG